MSEKNATGNDQQMQNDIVELLATRRGYRQEIKDLVSVIVPIFNAAEYLEVCINSVLNQLYNCFELWLIDDGSIDGSSEICDRYALGDSRIKVIHQINSGVSGARNVGLKHAIGEFIFFLDADDYLNPDSLLKLVEAAKKTCAEMVVGNSWFLSAQGRRLGCRLDEDKLLDKRDMAYYLLDYLRMPQKADAMFTCWGKLFLTSIIRGKKSSFDLNASCFEDTGFLFHYLKNINSIAYLKEPLYNYLVKDSSLAFNISGHPRNIFGFFKSLPLMDEFLRGKADETEISRLIGNAYVTLTIIKMVHLCRNFCQETSSDIYVAISEVVNNPLLRQGLPFYHPDRNGSRMLPILMKYKLVKLIAAICRYKAYQRFGKEK